MFSVVLKLVLNTPAKVDSSPLKKGGWKTILSYWVLVNFQALFSGVVLFHEKHSFSCGLRKEVGNFLRGLELGTLRNDRIDIGKRIGKIW